MSLLSSIFSFPLGGNSPTFEKESIDFSVEVRVRFPTSDDELMAPTELSGGIWTLSNDVLPIYDVRLWYEKSAATSLTGNIFLTSSAGRLSLDALPIFDGDFYNLTMVKSSLSGTCTITALRYVDGEEVFHTSSVALISGTGYPVDGTFNVVELGSSQVYPSRGQFWASEFRLWDSPLTDLEVRAHAAHFESYGRDRSYDNIDLAVHWRLADGVAATGASGTLPIVDSGMYGCHASGSGFVDATPFDKFLESFGYIPSIDYGWNQEKVRVYDGSSIDPSEQYIDERFVSLEMNMYDALNEDISHVMSSYDEMNVFLGLPVNRYREDYEGLQQMRETYFQRLQGDLRMGVFVDMLDFFDRSFVDVIQRLLPARALFKGDELIVESHMLERPKYQYQLRPVRDGVIDISGSISVTELEWDRLA